MKKTNYEAFHKETSVQKYIISRNDFTYRIIIDILKKYLSTEKKVLDIGCGAGTMSFYIASKGNNVLGIDISRKAIEACRETATQLNLQKKTNFQIMDFPNKLPNKRFDLIVIFEVIEHLHNDKLALDSIFKLLKKGGIAIISTPSKNAPLYRLGVAKKFDRRVGHLRRYTMEELKIKCVNAGFEILETKKTEGIVRNFLYLNPIAGKFIRFIKFFMVDIVLFLDKIFMKLFGESDLFVIVKKPL